MIGGVPLRSGTVLVKDLPTHYGQLVVIVKKCFLCQSFAYDQMAQGHLRIVAAIIMGANIDWAFIMLNLWKENIEEAKSNPKRKTYLRMIGFYLFKLNKLPKDDGVPFTTNKFISFRRKESGAD
ncbi:hypothetical protein Droror1_Dr00023447 [Drosera rotundifolia]